VKIAFDENVPIALVSVFTTFANERQLKRKIGAIQVVSAVEYTPKKTDEDYKPNNDVPWIKRFAAAGGKAIVSGNTQMRFVPHERMALVQNGMLVFFFDSKWNEWDFFRKVSLLIYHWPAIAARIKGGRAPAFWYIPLSWNEKAKLRKVPTEDPRLIKAKKAAKPRRAPPKKAPVKETPPPIVSGQTSFMDLLEPNKDKSNG